MDGDRKKTILFDEEGNLNLCNLKNNFKDGIGQIGRLSDTGVDLIFGAIGRMLIAIETGLFWNIQAVI